MNKARKHHRGGEGGCFRAYVLDSESGGAYSRYPELRTTLGHPGSASGSAKAEKNYSVIRGP